MGHLVLSKKIFQLFFFKFLPKTSKDLCAVMFLLFHIFLFFFSCLFWFPLNPPILPCSIQTLPRDVAVEKGHAGTVRALLEGKANLTANALHVAAEKEKIEVHKTHIGSFWSHISFWGGSKNFRLMLIFNAEKMYEKGYFELQNPHPWLNEDGNPLLFAQIGRKTIQWLWHLLNLAFT